MGKEEWLTPLKKRERCKRLLVTGVVKPKAQTQNQVRDDGAPSAGCRQLENERACRLDRPAHSRDCRSCGCAEGGYDGVSASDLDRELRGGGPRHAGPNRRPGLPCA